MGEIIPIPQRRATDKRPINIEFQPRSMPGQRFAVRMDWNDVAGIWTVEIVHVTREHKITKSAAKPYRTYDYEEYVYFVFIDPSGSETEITPQNLGDEVRLFVFPGVAGQPPDEW